MKPTGAFVAGVLVSGVALFALAIGSGSLTFGAKTDNTTHACTGTRENPCVVNVIVSGCVVSHYGCSLSVDNELLLVNSNKTPVTLVWVLNDRSKYFTFSGASIQFGSDATDISPCTAQVGGNGAWTVTCPNANTKFAAYKYTLNLQGLPPIDPWVVND